MARRSLVDAIGLAWRHPRRAMAAEIAAGLSERRALLHLMLACGLFFVASLPNAVREARALPAEDPVGAAVAAHLYGYLALVPLLAYLLAAVVHLVARGFGARGGFLPARAALFWSALAGAPLALAVALAGIAAEASASPALVRLAGWLGLAALGFWLWLFSASLAEAEGFAATGRVVAVVAAAFAGIGGLLALAAGGQAA
jgi:hypothetical protein